jgi:CBS domain-containing protein
MKVREIMTKDPKCCGPDTNLAAAAELMWNNDCGVLPVVEDGKLAGIITDRDVCIAVGTRNRLPTEIKVGDAAAHEVRTCSPEDDVETAMAIMRREQVRRLPVVSDAGRLEGILALNDIILAADGKYGGIDSEDVMKTIRAVSGHRGQKPVAWTVLPPIQVVVA